jgi:hypothetical protein
VAIILFSAGEIWYRYFKNVKRVELKLPENLKGSVMTELEFEERIKKGEKLLILDDLVLNVAGFMN